MGIISTIVNGFVDAYTSIVSSLPDSYGPVINIFLYTILIVGYSIFVFQFYRFLARKNIIKINLNQYNRSEHPLFKKLFAMLFFFLEYIVILPILAFFWFAVLAFILMLLSENQPLSQILLVSAAVVGAIRVTSYFKEDLSRDLAKMFPFTVLAIFLLSPDFLEFTPIVDKLSEIPAFFSHIVTYLVFIVILEIIIRIFYSISLLFRSSIQEEIDKNQLPEQVEVVETTVQ